ncbi:MAG: AMP-binding protein [Salaquimonas sp.]
MLPSAQTYEELAERFAWDIPDNYNMGVDVCDKWAYGDPDRLAIIDLTGDDRKDFSFSQLKEHSDKLATYLMARGVAFGDRVGVYRSQSAWTAIAHIAIWKIGAISIPLFKLFGEEALKMRLIDSGAKAVITDEESVEAIFNLNDDLPDLMEVLVVDRFTHPDITDFHPVKTTADVPAVLIYTSGTTGPPKGALHGHRILLGHLPGVEMSHDLFPHENDVLWTPADWAWIGGLFDVLMPGLHHGVPVVASRMEKFSSAQCRDIMEKAGVTNVFFPPTALKMLKADDVTIKGLRTVASGGEPLGAEMLKWGKEALGVTINEFYGQTECNMVVSSCAKLFAPKPGAMGKPVPGHDVRVLNGDGEPTEGEGDIAVKVGTPVMMLEYWNNPVATRDKFRMDKSGTKWLITGDRGIMDGNSIRFIGRDDDVITSAGYRIGPAEIEDCLLKHPSVAAAGVIGKPDAQRTEIVKAYIVLRVGFEPNPTLEQELQEYVKTRLAKYEYPREIEFLEALPMTVTGKIIRRELKRRAIEELAGTQDSAEIAKTGKV